MPSVKHAWFTICSANYLAYAKTLFASLNTADPRAGKCFFLVLVDDQLPDDVAASLEFPVILASDLGIPEFWDMAFRYSVMELNTAVKPAAILHLMERGFDRVTYLDPDIFVVKPLKHVCKAHDDGADVVLTPHSTVPLEDGLDPDDLRLMRTGAYNLGFGSFSSATSSRRLLEWWHRRMLADCRVDLENGLFVDQKFMDLAPSYADRTTILRHPGYNVAYWNLPSRPVSHAGGKWVVKGGDLHFFHFSGVVPGDPTVFSKHQNRFGVDDIGDLKDLLETYLGKLAEHGHNEFKDLPYSYATYTDGQPIPGLARRVYADALPPSAVERDIAFAPDFSLLEEPADDMQGGRLPISRAMSRIWKERPDLSRSFSIADAAGRRAFCVWFLSAAEREYGLPPAAYESVRTAISADHALAANGAESSSVTRWFARAVIGQQSRLRTAYRKLPHDVRVRIRDVLIRKASGHAARGAQIAAGERTDRSLQPGLGLFGYFSAVSGVGEGARRMARVLDEAGIKTTLHPLRTNGHASEAAVLPGDVTHGASPFNCLLFHVNADQIQVKLDEQPAEWLRGRYRIGYWAWELAKFPDTWRTALDYVHEVWVPSEFVKQSVAAKTTKPVNVVPHPIPKRRDSGESRVGFSLPADQFLFLCSLDLKSFMARKNPLAAYEAFRRAFPDTDARSGPRLVVKLHSGLEQNEAERQLVTQLQVDERVILIDVPLSNERYAALQRLCDAYVSLHRSEGFGMNIAECMQLAKPVIATDYSGNRDYLKPEYGYPVKYELIPVRPGEYPQSEDQVWADPDLGHAAELMRHVYTNQKDAQGKAKIAKAFIEREYSISRVAQTVRGHFERIQADQAAAAKG
ncbi:glycosyltransferase family 1 protein [Henriciella mobilis]|uniref:glycosyltransferase family 4 protein n=1 Tax=Henriciella mobilis TaxID=2305467 RepID=UPI000E669B23|nr:glycosyltransferase [Henriciella mobilis]RIJ17148.1 glycosyltransferase family 1 protein [Henriciella mobilis]RIJ22755.1 glycosyltransferase family 1 protein [Henriciella mobilis]